MIPSGVFGPATHPDDMTPASGMRHGPCADEPHSVALEHQASAISTSRASPAARLILDAELGREGNRFVLKRARPCAPSGGATIVRDRLCPVADRRKMLAFGTRTISMATTSEARRLPEVESAPEFDTGGSTTGAPAPGLVGCSRGRVVAAMTW